jgi:triacylglycerol lipase
MTPLGLVETGLVQPTPPPIAPPAPFKLLVEDALASRQRLWVRGRVFGLDLRGGREPDSRWWHRIWGKSEGNGAPAEAVLTTHVSGSVFQAKVPLRPDGRFEAFFTGNLPPARRGWRVARNCLAVGGQSVEGCGLVMAPSQDATGTAVVVLPLAGSFPKTGPQDLAQAEAVVRLVPVLQRLQQRAHGRLALYYLAGVSGREEGRQAELALAATALGFPAGNFLLVPGGADIEADLARAVDRLRWLFACCLDLKVINLEPTAARALAKGSRPAEDRAAVSQLINPDENPWGLLDDEAPAAERPVYLVPRRSRDSRLPCYPIVFCHGMLAFTTLRMQRPADSNYFSPLREFFRERGFRVLYPQVAPTAGVVERAGQLYEQITRWTDEPVNLVAHSMGGLDARYLITHLGLANQVRSLTTVSTPHRGTYLADWFTANFRQRIPLLLALEALGFNVDGFRDCRLEACREFNATTPDAPGVRYFSYGGEAAGSRLSPVLRRAWNILTPVEGPNDGMVSVASARWGEYLGTIHADHFAQTPDAMYLRPGEDFDSLGFFSRLVEDLARRGF